MTSSEPPEPTDPVDSGPGDPPGSAAPADRSDDSPASAGEVGARLPPPDSAVPGVTEFDRHGRGTAEGEPAEALLEGYLSPGVLFLSLLDALRSSVVMVSFAWIARERMFAFLAIALFVFVMLAQLARYLTFRYRLTTEELVTTHGILHRQERRIPINRVQDLSFESTIVRRMLGLVVVSVETASGAGAEAELDSLSRVHAEELREALYRARSRQLAGTARDPAVAGGAVSGGVAPPLPIRRPVPEHLLYRATPGQLTLLGLTNNRIGVVVAAIYGAWELLGQLGVDGHAVGWISAVFQLLRQLPWSLLLLAMVMLLFLALIGGWLVSIVANHVMFHGFTLTLRDDVCQRRYGLLTTRSATLPRSKIQRVLFEARLLRWWIGYTVVRADSAGSGTRQDDRETGGRDVVAPLVPVAHAEALSTVLLPGFHPARGRWYRVSSRVIGRVLLQGIVLTAILAPIAWSFFGVLGALVFFLIPAAYAVGALSYANLAFARHPEHLVLRWGILGRYRAIVPLRKLQGVVVREPVVDRLFRLAELTVYVAGGSPSRLRYLPVETARALQADVGRFAARSRFIW